MRSSPLPSTTPDASSRIRSPSSSAPIDQRLSKRSARVRAPAGLQGRSRTSRSRNRGGSGRSETRDIRLHRESSEREAQARRHDPHLAVRRAVGGGGAGGG